MMFWRKKKGNREAIDPINLGTIRVMPNWDGEFQIERRSLYFSPFSGIHYCLPPQYYWQVIKDGFPTEEAAVMAGRGSKSGMALNEILASIQNLATSLTETGAGNPGVKEFGAPQNSLACDHEDMTDNDGSGNFFCHECGLHFRQ